MTRIQLAFDIHTQPVYQWENYFVSSANQEAVHWIQQWPQWPSCALLLQGPTHAGKSHLAYLWQQKTKAHQLDSNQASLTDILAQLHTHPFIIIHQADQLADQLTLLAVYNTVREHQGGLLLTTTKPLSQWPYTLHDLTSRLKTIPTAQIFEPDDALMRAIFIKQFSDVQVRISDTILDYLMIHIERSYASIYATVHHLNTLALAQRRSLTLPFVRDILNNSLSKEAVAALL